MGAEADDVGNIGVQREERAGAAGEGVFGLGVAAGHGAGEGAQDIDGGVAAGLRDAAIKHDVAVEDAADGVGNGFVVVVALDEDGEERGDAAWRAVGAGAGAFEEAGQVGEDAGRIAAGGGRFAGGEADFAQREAVTGDAVHKKKNALAEVAKMFRDGESGIGGFAAHQGGRIGGGNDDDGAGEAFGAEVILKELAHFAAALANEGEDDDVTVGAAGKHGQESGFAHAGAGEKAEALAGATGGEGVEGADTKVDAGAEAGAAGGLGRGGAERAGGWALGEGALAVERAAERVDDAADPGCIDG